jgi:hypothetical protein
VGFVGLTCFDPDAYVSAPSLEDDLLRLHPWPDAAVTGELGAEELRTVANAGWPEPWTA